MYTNDGHRNRFLPLPDNTDHFTGDLTYYGPGLGACGIESTDNDAIVSVSHYLFDAVQTGSDPNQNSLCGRKIRATRVDERSGKQVSIDVKVVDRCMCANWANTSGRLIQNRYWLQAY